MADVVNPIVRSRMMSGIRGKDTQPEIVLRKGLFRLGVRYRLHVPSLPGRPDIVIGKFRVVVMIHGCFWHAHAECRHFRLPSSNRAFWQEKLERNKARDLQHLTTLLKSDWRVAVVWECAIRSNPHAVVQLVNRFIRSQSGFLEISEEPLPCSHNSRKPVHGGIR